MLDIKIDFSVIFDMIIFAGSTLGLASTHVKENDPGEYLDLPHQFGSLEHGIRRVAGPALLESHLGTRSGLLTHILMRSRYECIKGPESIKRRVNQ